MVVKIERIEIENVLQPGKTYRVEAVKYWDVRNAILAALPQIGGFNVEEMYQAILPLVSQELFPNGEKLVWWMKAAQLDLEAKSLIKRQNTKPLSFVRVN